MISNSVLIIYGSMALIGLIGPLALFTIWIKKTHQPVRTILIGVAIFFIFAIVLESFPKTILFQDNNPIGSVILSNQILYVIVAALLAGVFEEVGRLVAFKYFLKDRKDKLTAITYGIGHGGFEIMYLFVLGGVQSLILAILVKTGQYHDLVMIASMQSPGQYEALQAIPQALANTSFDVLLFSCLERISALLIHISCSIIVFKAVRQKGCLWMIQLAVLAHASIDVIAAMYQVGILSNIYIVEALIILWAIVLFGICFKFIYKKMPTELN